MGLSCASLSIVATYQRQVLALEWSCCIGFPLQTLLGHTYVGVNRMTWVDEWRTHGMPDLRMWFAVLTGLKSARGRVLRMWAVKGHLDWSDLISLIGGEFSYH